MDILEVYSEISNTVQLFQEHREKAVDTFRNIYDSICLMTSLFGKGMPEIPRLAARQTLRSNLPVSSPDSCWRASVFIPSKDSLISELCSRFTSLTQKAVQALLLLPANMRNLKRRTSSTSLVLMIQTYLMLHSTQLRSTDGARSGTMRPRYLRLS